MQCFCVAAVHSIDAISITTSAHGEVFKYGEVFKISTETKPQQKSDSNVRIAHLIMPVV